MDVRWCQGSRVEWRESRVESRESRVERRESRVEWRESRGLRGVLMDSYAMLYAKMFHGYDELGFSFRSKSTQ